MAKLSHTNHCVSVGRNNAPVPTAHAPAVPKSGKDRVVACWVAIAGITPEAQLQASQIRAPAKLAQYRSVA
jgi:hypothetical protein